MMDFPRKIAVKWRELGSAGFVRLMKLNMRFAVSTQLDRCFDLRYGTDTARPIHGPQLGAEGENTQFGTSYFPTTVATLNRILAKARLDFGRYTCVEFGSGKGRIVLSAAMRPFISVIGIEYSPLLHDIATANLARLQKSGRVRAPAQFICMDAVDYEIPPEPCLFFFFNPFMGEVADRVLENISRRPEGEEPDILVWIYSREAPVNASLQQSFVRHRFIPVLSFDVRDRGGERRFCHLLVKDSPQGLRRATQLCTYRSAALGSC